MAEGRASARRRAAKTAPDRSKAEMRADLNRMIESFLAKGGKITDCNGCMPERRRIPPFSSEDAALPDTWD